MEILQDSRLPSDIKEYILLLLSTTNIRTVEPCFPQIFREKFRKRKLGTEYRIRVGPDISDLQKIREIYYEQYILYIELQAENYLKKLEIFYFQ